MLVYCGQTVGWIKIELGMEVALGPSDNVSDGDSALPLKRAQFPTNFQPMSIVAKFFSDTAIFVLKRDVKLQLTN